MNEGKYFVENCFSRRAVLRRIQRKKRLRRLKLAIVLCVLIALACLLLGNHLAGVSVQRIVFEGQAHYTEGELAACLPVSLGDRMYAMSEDALAQTLRSELPYLSDVQISTSLDGTLTVSVRERSACWALAVQDGYALLDGELIALETVDNPGDLCVVLAQGLPPHTPGQALDQTAAALEAQARAERAAAKEAGLNVSDFVIPDYSTPVALLQQRLQQLTQAFAEAPEDSVPARIRLTDRYDLVLWLRDGTQISLGNDSDLPTKYQKAMEAIAAYRQRYPQLPPQTEILVEVSDLSHIRISQITAN